MSWRPFTLLALAALGCAAWRTLAAYGSSPVFAAAPTDLTVVTEPVHLGAARAAVESWLGPFQGPVEIHLSLEPAQLSADGRKIVYGANSKSTGARREGLEVRGYHLSRRGPTGGSGIFLHDPRPGTLIHEMVHARLAEESEDLPLWFEEGIACLLSDGLLFGGHWVRDGFSSWPWAELRQHRPSGIELAEILELKPQSTSSVQDNLLAHFVGWALVFDLWRETQSDDWRRWQTAFNWDHPLQDAERRLNRVLGPGTPARWLRARLASPITSVRLAALRGTWKLESSDVMAVLLGALELERDSEVRVALAVNILASVEAGTPPLATRLKIHEAARKALVRSSLPDPLEALAVQELVLALDDERRDATLVLKRLRRFWDE